MNETARRVREIVRNGLAAADRLGVSQVRTGQLKERQVEALAKATLEFLRSRKSSPSPKPGWTLVPAAGAGVLPWWAELADIVDESERTRLRPLRQEIYDLLEEHDLIEKGPGQGAPVHVSPLGDVVSADEFADRTIKISVTPTGAGYGDPETNRRVELAAMATVSANYSGSGWEVEDVSRAKCGWDITVRRDETELHLEVKGVSGPMPSILLTANEYDTAATDPLWRLAVVTRALVAPQAAEYDRSTVQCVGSPYVYRVDLT